jgi:hypothetical protein
MSKLELETILAALGGVRATARALGCSPATICAYRTGAPVPRAIATRLRMIEWDKRAAHRRTPGTGPS